MTDLHALATESDLTEAERRCCHMRDAAIDWTPDAIARWRREFAQLPRTECCNDCPARKAAS